jgi:PAS domain S-box-containing protein
MKSAHNSFLDSALAAVFNAAQTGMCLTDENGRIVLVNPEACRMFQLNADELVGHRFLVLLDDTQREAARQAYNQVLNGAALRQPDWHVALRDGSTRWVRVSPSRIESPEGILVLNVLADVTDYHQAEQALELDLAGRRRAEEALRFSEARMRAIFEQSPIAIQRFAPDGLTLEVNAAWEQLWGTARENVQGYNVLEDAQAERRGVLKVLRRAFEGEPVAVPPSPYVPEESGNPGRPRWVEAFAYPVQDDGKILEVVMMLRDVTQRKEAEEQSRRARERYESLALATAQVVWNTTAEGEVVDDLPTWREFTGQSQEEILGRGWAAAVHPDDLPRVAEVWQRSLETGTAHENEFRVRRHDGEYRTVLARAVPVKEPDGSVREWVGTLSDVTERREAEEQLRQSELRFRQLAENIHEVFYLSQIDPPEMVYVSPGYEAIWGRSCDSLYENPESFVDAVLEEDRRSMQERLRRQAAGEPTQGLYRIRRPDGEVRWIFDRSTSIVEDGRVVRVAGIAEDVTERRLAELTLEVRVRQQAAVAELGHLALARAPLDLLMDRAVRGVAETLEVPLCKVLQLTPERDRLLLLAGVGWDEGLVGTGHVGADLNSQAGFTLASDEPVIVHSLADETRFSGPELLHRHGVVSGVSCTIEGPDGAWGVLGAHDRERRAFTRDDTNFLLSVANILGQAIIRDKAEEGLRDETRALETINRIGSALSAELNMERLVQMLTDEATQLTGAEFGSFFYNVEDEKGAHYMLYTLSGVPPEAFANFPMPRKTQIFAPTFDGIGVVRLEDVKEDPRYGHEPPHHGMPEGHLPVRSYLAVPVKLAEGEVIGGLFFGHSQPGMFTERHERIVMSVASQAAVAFENARLYSRVRSMNQELERRVKDRTAELEAANREMEGFTYSVSHDLRAPLRAIVATSRILLDDFGSGLPPQATVELERQARAAKKLGILIDDLLRLSRLGRQEMAKTDVDLSEMAAEIAADMCRRWELEPQITIQPDLRAHGDARLLRLALENLIDNACKFSAPGVRAEVAFGQDEHGTFFVRDNGVGFDMQYAHKLFLPFERLVTDAEYPGTGVGLANVKRIVERHGGRVWAESTPGEGATFYFTL